jgi:hypothetical protein
MTTNGPLNLLPTACTLTPGAGREQVVKWQAFDADYALGVEHSDTQLVVQYARTDDAVDRLRELVAIESTCCSFVTWTIQDTDRALRLLVTGTPDQLHALTIGAAFQALDD